VRETVGNILARYDLLEISILEHQWRMIPSPFGIWTLVVLTSLYSLLHDSWRVCGLHDDKRINEINTLVADSESLINVAF